MVPGLVAPVALTGSDEKSKSSHQASSALTVFHHSLITTTIDQLRFDAAASLQLRPKQGSLSTAKMGHELIASPYNEPGNLLDLRRLPLQEQLLAKAFTIFRPMRDDYAQAKYEESFNYQATIEALRVLAAEEGHVWKSQAYLIVYFRSELREDADRHLLAEADNLAHGEAMASGGLLKYWFGKAGDDGKNLATCRSCPVVCAAFTDSRDRYLAEQRACNPGRPRSVASKGKGTCQSVQMDRFSPFLALDW